MIIVSVPCVYDDDLFIMSKKLIDFGFGGYNSLMTLCIVFLSLVTSANWLHHLKITWRWSDFDHRNLFLEIIVFKFTLKEIDNIWGDEHDNVTNIEI